MIVDEKLVEPHRQSKALAGMFEARKRVFVDLLKWDLGEDEHCAEGQIKHHIQSEHAVLRRPHGRVRHLHAGVHCAAIRSLFQLSLHE